MHGSALALNHVWEKSGIRLPRLLGWAMTLLFVMGAFVLFRSPSFTVAASMWEAMGGTNGLGGVTFDLEHWAALLGGGAVVLAGIPSQDLAFARLRPRPWIAVPVGAAAVWLVLLIGGRLPNVFIYFQF